MQVSGERPAFPGLSRPQEYKHPLMFPLSWSPWASDLPGPAMASMRMLWMAAARLHVTVYPCPVLGTINFFPHAPPHKSALCLVVIP